MFRGRPVVASGKCVQGYLVGELVLPNGSRFVYIFERIVLAEFQSWAEPTSPSS